MTKTVALLPELVEREPFRVWQSGEWTILHVCAGGVETTSSLTRDQARLLSWKLRNSPRQAPEVPHWNGVGKYSPCISFDAGALNVNGGGFGDSDGSGCFVFRDDELDFEQEDGPLYRWINVSNSDLLHLRDKLNELFPEATQTDQQLREEVERLREVLDIARHELRRQHDGVDFERTKRCRGLIEQIDDALSSSSLTK